MSTSTMNFVYTLYLLAINNIPTFEIGNLSIALSQFPVDGSIIILNIIAIIHLNLKHVKIIFTIFSIIQKQKIYFN